MTTEPDNLTPVFLRRIDAKLDRLIVDVGDLQSRVTSLEQTVARLHAGQAALHGDFAGQSARIDRMAEDIARINRRLDLATAE